MTHSGEDQAIEFTVASLWREARISCPHPDILKAYLAESLDPGAAEFVTFHIHESSCPYCAATVDDFRAQEAASRQTPLQDLRDRLLRSTVTALRKVSGA